MSSSDIGGFSWYAAGMPLRPATTLALTTFLSALSMAPTVAAQPIEPLGSARPAAPAAPADVAAAPADATKTESGLAFKVLAKPRGTTHPGPHDKVTINFTGWTPQGEVIASSVPDGEPWALLLDDAIKGLAEGLLLMGKGEKRRLWIPAELATSGRPKRRGPPGPAVFDVELVSFAKVPDPIPVPEDVAAAPADAKRTASGIAYKLLKRGKGKAHPTAESTVEVHYSGWTPDGKLFDSSVRRGKPTSFPLNAVIKGWTEGVQLLVVGDKARFWIPGALAYGDKPNQSGTPTGPLVFDVELLSIK
jgi:FKBP-type peptidyl-prolyl cis-trans isomerase